MPTVFEIAHATRQLPQPALRRHWRELAGASQDQIAAQLGVTRTSVSRWEKGTRSPRGENLVAYSILLGQLREIANG
jgi:transcriptional regulator with XRE-family HTH domain